MFESKNSVTISKAFPVTAEVSEKPGNFARSANVSGSAGNQNQREQRTQNGQNGQHSQRGHHEQQEQPRYHTGYTEYIDLTEASEASGETAGTLAVPSETACKAYFNEVYARTFKSVSRYVVSKCKSLNNGEDILQDTYARFYKYISNNGWSNIQNEEAFLVHIAKFECKTYFAGVIKEKEVSSFSDYSEEQMVEIEREMSLSDKTSSGLEDVLCNSILAKEIYSYIIETDPDIGRIFYLHFAQGLKLDEVAEELGATLSYVKNKVYRTIDRIKKKFDV